MGRQTLSSCQEGLSPFIGTREGIAIRLCEVIQPVIPETVAAHEEEWVEP